MKIVHVITRLILGGAQENTILTCEGLARRGHEVTLITGPPLGPEGQLLDRARAGGYKVIVLDALRRPIHPLRDRASYRALVRHFRTLRPDVMHSHSSKAGILARRAAVRAGVPFIVHTIHGLPFHPHQPRWLNRLYAALERRAARRTDAILCVADAMTRQAVDAGVAGASKFTTVYSGMETGRFLRRPPAADAFRASLDLPPDAVLVTQVARLAPLKGQAYLIEAAKALDERIHVCLVGDGVLTGKLTDAIRRAGLEHRFHLTGLLPPDDIPAVMHASDIVAHCSLHEGLARTLPQALLTGTPVVSFNIDGAPEVVVPDDTGCLVEPADVDGLVVAIGRLADNQALRERLGRQGREKAAAMFDAETMVERIEAVYTHLTEGVRREA
ncbi:MAG: glycosyltransferase family 4 protein [Planctomycetota bacterium]